CLIACALYEDFWLKLIRYLESQGDPELVPATRDAFERACTVHHPDKPSLHLMWSAFEECQNNHPKAAEILTNLEKVCPNLLQVAYRRINLERRRGDYVKCSQLYEHYIGVAKGKNMASNLAIKYARFCHKVKGDLDGGMEVLKIALEKDTSNTRIALQMIDLALQRPKVDEKEVVEIMDSFMGREGMDAEQKVLFAQRKVEFLEDFGSTAKGLQDAQRELQQALAKANESKKKARSQFERALAACGLEFRSDKLWEAYIKWETEGKRIGNVAGIYDRLLGTPTQGYNGHFDSFSEIVSNNAPQIVLSVEEFLRVRGEVREASGTGTKSTSKVNDEDVILVGADKENVEKGNEKVSEEKKDNEEKKEEAEEESAEKKDPVEKMEVDGEEKIDEEKAQEEQPVKAEEVQAEPEVEADDHVANEEEAQAIKDKILSSRRKLHKQTVAAVTARWIYEEAIKRPYFHVKPLERCQLKNWKDYLDYEIEQ
uniref:Suppressor of forked domain-containing protein n=1 Tax=Phlebotomus papatasi TaxID=29031 RepID=A0A1B0D734_PHLPP